MSGHLLWTVFVDAPDVDRWRGTLGQVDIDDWCAAHGWDSNRVLLGSVNVFAYRDGHAEVVADIAVTDPRGQPVFDKRAREVCRRTESVRLARSLPEGIGTVLR